MAIDLTGIYNENEFYTHHYLSAILESDLKDLYKTWSQEKAEQDIQPPWEKFRGLQKEFLKFRNKLEKEPALPARQELHHKFLKTLLPLLGYDFKLSTQEIDDGSLLPVIGNINKPSGAPELWILSILDPDREDTDPLSLPHQRAEEQDEKDTSDEFSKLILSDVISKGVFGRSEPPKWVIVASESQLILIDRSKWGEKRFLRFDLTEIFNRKEESTLKAATALIHRNSVCPKEGLNLLDRLDENSHKHAHAVSEDLKYALRKAIELLGNEVVYDMETRLKEKRFNREADERYGQDLAEQLSIECLRYMYRLLFLFYIEARPELGYVQMDSDAYRKGYSLESLRDLEMVQLTTDESREGFYIHDSLKLLFKLIFEGHITGEKSLHFGGPIHHSFKIAPLKSHLFDPAGMPLLNRVKLRNGILQEIIQLMSLSRENTSGKKGKKIRRGRVSYAQLGINQLGSVYESLLSYQGFFAKTDLYEVKKAKDQYNELKSAYFVKADDLEKYDKKTEWVYEEGDEKTLKKHSKGKFIYRLAGRARQKSASYYTPESLTQCLVKYALKELLKDKTADDILQLTVCEPAMGSGAFLNEAVNQLAEAYLQKKQKEIGETISHDCYAMERQKVKMYIADNNVYGIDLNPVAVELAEVSLWLNTIYEGAYVPWFGNQLKTGNSLVGARRQVFSSHLLSQKNKKDSLWLSEVPERVMPGKKRAKGTVYHFLLPDNGMVDYKDKVINKLAKNEIDTIKRWKKEFTKPFSNDEISRLERLSDAVDRLYQETIELMIRIRNRTDDPLQVFGQPEPKEGGRFRTTQEKDKILHQELLSKNVRNSSAYRRLKLVMDYWCALWFWSIEKADLLPSREEFFLDLDLILEGNVIDTGPAIGENLSLFPETIPKQMAMNLVDDFGFVDVDRLCRENPRFGQVQELSEQYRFLHWELEFADLFHERGGFDLVLGNPPWVKVEWKEGGVLGDKEPLFVLRKYGASKLAHMRDEVLTKNKMRSSYLCAYEEADATQNFLNAQQNYPVLKGSQCNLYKCFLPQAWMLGSENFVSSFIHPEGIYDDPKGGDFRNSIFPRLRYHFQIQNQLLLFPIGDRVRYSLNVYSNPWDNGFYSISNIIYPQTIDLSFCHDGAGAVPGIKECTNYETNAWDWSRQGHSHRIIHILKKELSLFARLYDIEGTKPLQARLPALHSKELMQVLEKLATQPRCLCDLEGQCFSTVMWDETNAVKKDHTIRRETRFPVNPSEWILSGPHFYVGRPFNKTPRAVCTEKAHYDTLDLTQLPADYLPRTNYVPDVDTSEYLHRTPKVPWNGKPVTDFYRLCFRGMLPPPNERTLIGCIIPPGMGHINGAQTIAFRRSKMLISAAFFGFSIVSDFFIKSTGRTNLHYIWERFPFFDNTETNDLRVLSLSSLTSHYANLWSECWNDIFTQDRWAKSDPRLPDAHFTNLTSKWHRDCAFRTDYIRRQALVEIDVLSAMELGLTLGELKTIYRVQFPVLQQYESDTWYDTNGRIVFTNNKGLSGIGFSRQEWDEFKNRTNGTVEQTVIDDTLPGGPKERTITYQAPFDRCDREQDYEVAWKHFEERFSK